MMKKIGIVTLFGYVNYGNRLQNYAVQEILKKYGFTVTTLVVRDSIKPIFKTVFMFIKACTNSIPAKRYIKIRKFSKKNISEKIIYKRDLKIPSSISKKFDYFVVGSDQVWNPYIRFRERDNFFLRFAEKNQRLCISPSFGVEEIPDKYKKDYENGINGFSYLSSREEEGAKIIFELTGKRVPVLIDPTMALSQNEWKKLFKVPHKFCKGNYMVCSFLGKVTDKRKGILNSFSQNANLKKIDVLNDAIYSPDELVYILANAKLICTDSFHFCAFSINFNIPFIVFEREGEQLEEKMFSRIKTLLNTFYLQDRVFDNRGVSSDYLTCDFTKANEIMENERKRFYEYIEIILKSEGNE